MAEPHITEELAHWREMIPQALRANHAGSTTIIELISAALPRLIDEVETKQADIEYWQGHIQELQEVNKSLRDEVEAGRREIGRLRRQFVAKGDR